VINTYNKVDDCLHIYMSNDSQSPNTKSKYSYLLCLPKSVSENIDSVKFIFGNMSWISRVVYGLVGICGLYLITFYMRLGDDAE